MITAASLVGLCALGIMTGYGLRGLRRGDQMFIYYLYILQMVIPAMLIIIPQFLIVQSLQRLIPGTDQPDLAGKATPTHRYSSGRAFAFGGK